MSANLRLEGNFLESINDLFTNNVNGSLEYSDDIFSILGGNVLKGVAFLLLIELILKLQLLLLL